MHIRHFFIIVITFAILSNNYAWANNWDLHGSLGKGTSKHKRYVPPIANPIFNETPYITTEVRIIHQHTEIPGSWVSTGGEINLYAAQFRIALTENLGFLATKDGFANANFKNTLKDEDGFANIAAGFKYAIHSNSDNNSIFTAGLRYEAPTGSLESSNIRLQGKKGGFLNLFFTGSKAFAKLGLQGSFGLNSALDGDHDNSMFHYSATANYEVYPNFFPTFELNGYATTDDGNRTSGDYAGVDILNFGTTDSGHIALASMGVRYLMTDHISLGGNYEFPVTNREDIVDWRTQIDLIISY